MSELEPTFAVRPRLDGDDDAAIQTDNFLAALTTALDQMRADGLICDYGIVQLPDDRQKVWP